MTEAENPTTESSDVTERPQRASQFRRVLRLGFLVAVGLLITGFVFRGSLLANWELRSAVNAVEAVRLTDAETSLRKALEHDPNNLKCLLLLCRVLRFQDRIGESMETLANAMQLGCSSERARKERLLNDARLGQLTATEAFLSQLLADDALDSRDVCEAFVVGFRQHGRFENAELLLDAWELDWPGDYRIAAHRGIIQQMQNRWESAVKHYETAISLGDPRTAIKLRSGECLLEMKDAQQAVRVFEDCVITDPENADAWLNLSRSALLNGDAERAKQAIEECLRLDPKSFDASLILARIQLGNDETETACRQLEEMLREWPEDAAALYEYSQALARLGRKAAAEDAIERWKLADARNERIEHLVGELEASPTDLALRLEIGTLLMKHYSRRMGMQYLMVVLQMDPANQVAHELLIRYYESRGETDNAEAHRMALRGTSGQDPPEGIRP